jgi:hypothetical protein
MEQTHLREMRDNYVAHIKQYMQDMGGLFPHITVLGVHKEDKEQQAIIHIPIPDEFMESDERKDVFVDEIVPRLAEELNKKFIPSAVAWASEAWMRTAKRDEVDFEKVDYKTLPIRKEVLIIVIESDNSQESLLYEIKRQGKIVNEEGNMVDQIELEEITDYFGTADATPDKSEGRFSGLFKKFAAA